MVSEHNSSNGWKITAIIFIILFALETSVYIWAAYSVSKDTGRENKCAIDVCALSTDDSLPSEFDTYGYDTETQICQCYKDHEIKKQKYME